jgi:hypothetical protein
MSWESGIRWVRIKRGSRKNRSEPTRAVWYVGTIRWPALMHGLGIYPAARLEGPGRLDPIEIQLPCSWVLKTRCLDADAGICLGEAAAICREPAATAAQPHRDERLVKVLAADAAGPWASHDRGYTGNSAWIPACEVLVLFSDIGGPGGLLWPEPGAPHRGGGITPSRSSRARERP